MSRASRIVGVLLWLIILSLAICGTVLAKTEIIHFDYTSHGPAYVQFLEERAQEFEALYDVEITFITGNQDKFEVMAVAGTPPDVVDLPALDLGTWVAQDYFLDLRPYLENSEYKNAVNPLLLGHSTSSSGVLYQIPKSMTPSCPTSTAICSERSAYLLPRSLATVGPGKQPLMQVKN